MLPVIDLFAGPGGLSEGFASCRDNHQRHRFHIALSIEKDASAHRTLELRAFFRKFALEGAPKSYYDYLRRRLTRDELFRQFPAKSSSASAEAWHAELGNEKFPEKLIDRRIRQALGDRRDDWILIGGPPCQAYSLVGRARIIGERGRQAYERDHRHFLYKQYLRIIAEHRPTAFVLENVKGMLSASVDNAGVFPRILSDLQDPIGAMPNGFSARGKSLTYEIFPLNPASSALDGSHAPGAFVVRCEEFGIPQARHRVILVGLRSDIRRTLQPLEPRSLRVPLSSAIGDLPAIRSGLSKEVDSATTWVDAVRSLTTTGWWKSKEICQQVRARMVQALSELDADLSLGAEFSKGGVMPAFSKDWLADPRIGGVCNHSARRHIRGDLHRYLFSACFAEVNGRSPQLREFPRDLLPRHENVDEAVTNGKFGDRFRVQLSGRPATTITSHIGKDGHYFVHYRPEQCRSLTVREAARVQTFPDNYLFEGNRTEQYKQVGNAVPPLLALEIARAVATAVG